MLKRNFVGLALSAILVLATCPKPTSADTVTMKFTGVDPSRSVYLNLSGTSGEPSSTQAGVFNWTAQSYGGSWLGGNLGTYIDAFCIEITQRVYTNETYTYTRVNLDSAPSPGAGLPEDGMGLTKAALIRELWEDNMTAADKNASGVFKFSGNADKAAAFQLAIWEIVYDTNSSLTTPEFTGGWNNPTVQSMAQTMLDNLGNPLSSSNWEVIALSNEYKQDMVTARWAPTPSGGTPPIPSPVSAAMGIIGFMMVGLRRQRSSLA